ncbi:hypothetical protein BBJ28_00022882, partial [Nothophytophthora sp. Chile5]
MQRDTLSGRVNGVEGAEGQSLAGHPNQRKQHDGRRPGRLQEVWDPKGRCDLSIYNSFIESEDGQDIFIMATMCESHIVYLKNARAGWYGPVDQTDLQSAMCSDECLRSDQLHKQAMSLSRCTCAEVSADTFVRHDFCLESSARLLCTHLSECGHWSCQLEDFNCLRYEWDHLHPC